MKHVIIIGGGAAGLTAALCASRNGNRVTVLESAAKPGRKVLASGNGRCNMMNVSAPRYMGETEFAHRVLVQCPAAQVAALFASIGLAMHTEPDGRVYPACGQASAVTEVLSNALTRQGVMLETDCAVKALRREKGMFAAETPKGVLCADAVIAAMGGMAGGRLGHDGSAYTLLTRLGHTLIAPQPALTPLETEKKRVRGLSGLRLPAILTLCDGGRPVEAAAGEVLFADYGLSGICAMQLSRTAGELLRRGRKPVVYVDFTPVFASERVYARVPAQNPFRNEALARETLRARTAALPGENPLTGLMPHLLAAQWRDVPVQALPRMLCAMELPVTGVRGFDQAQVTAGGIAASEFEPETCRSKKVPGLLAAGEVLNVDGDCGGFNLLFAFATGILAGRNA